MGMRSAITIACLYLTTTIHCTEACQVYEPHITLGDQYNLEAKESTHAFMVGFVVDAACATLPRVVLLHDGSVTPIERFEVKSIDLVIGDVQYVKKALFFKVYEGDLLMADSWSIYQDSVVDELIPPVKFPKRARSNQESFRLFVVADLDLTQNGQATVQRIQGLNEDDYDAIVHVGDFAYEIETRGGKHGDEFFAQMSKTTRKIPYLITPGNHELYGQGNLLNYRFRMPNTDVDTIRANHFYDMVYKGCYFIFIDFDFLFIFKDQNPEAILFTWMQERMELLEQRTDVSWKVLVSHRPFSCSQWQSQDCWANMYFLRKYEDLLSKHGFHFLLNGHIHAYTRSKPLRGLVAMPQSKIGSGAMVSIVDGHSGTKHKMLANDDNERLRSAILEAVDNSGPSYVLVEVSSDRFQTSMVRSDTGELRDTFSIDRESLDDAVLRNDRRFWTKIAAMASVSVVLLLLAMLWKAVIGKSGDLHAQTNLRRNTNRDDYTKYSDDKQSVQSTWDSPTIHHSDSDVSPLSKP